MKGSFFGEEQEEQEEEEQDGDAVETAYRWCATAFLPPFNLIISWWPFLPAFEEEKKIVSFEKRKSNLFVFPSGVMLRLWNFGIMIREVSFLLLLQLSLPSVVGDTGRKPRADPSDLHVSSNLGR